MVDLPTLKSARGHVAHYEALVREFTHRRDHGDCVPDAESLTRWIGQAEADLKAWRSHLERAEAAERAGAREASA